MEIGLSSTVHPIHMFSAKPQAARGGAPAVPVGMMQFQVLIHMTSAAHEPNDKSCRSLQGAGVWCADGSGQVGQLAVTCGWPLAPQDMIEQALRGDVWYNKDQDDNKLVGEYG
jgi:hypothetical protein